MSCLYTSPQNGKAKRMIRMTKDVMRTLLIQASLSPRFWAESLRTATYLLNRLSSTTSPAPTPHHALFGTPPRYDHLRVFGCACYPNISATAPHKLAPHSTRYVFFGYSPLAGSSSPDTLCLTSRISPTPPPLHLPLTPSGSPCFRLTRWFSHICLSVLSLQIFLVRRHRFR